LAHLNVNTDACVVLTNKLEKLNRSAFPVAVRQALNSVAFDVKNNTLQLSAEKNFIRRSPNFFKTFSKVNKATGFNLNSMKAEVGMSDNGKQSARTAVNNMLKQEEGGVIKEGADYLAASRGNNNKKRVTKGNYFNKSNNLSGKFRQGGTSKSRFIAAAFASAKQKKKMSFETSRGRFLVQVTSIRKNKKGAIKIRSRLLIKDRSGKPVQITATHFSREAANMSSLKIERFYQIEAQKQFDRVLR